MMGTAASRVKQAQQAQLSRRSALEDADERGGRTRGLGEADLREPDAPGGVGVEELLKALGEEHGADHQADEQDGGRGVGRDAGTEATPSGRVSADIEGRQFSPRFAILSAGCFEARDSGTSYRWAILASKIAWSGISGPPEGRAWQDGGRAFGLSGVFCWQLPELIPKRHGPRRRGEDGRGSSPDDGHVSRAP